MCDPEQVEKMGNAMNILEALNGRLLRVASNRKKSNYFSRIWIHLKISKVIDFIDKLVM